MAKRKIILDDNNEVMMVLGENDRNIRQLERIHSVKINCSQDSNLNKYMVEIIGSESNVNKVSDKLFELRNKKTNNSSNTPSSTPENPDTVYRTYTGRRIVPMSKNQKDYIEAIRNYDMVISIGPAGTGKTFLAVASALAELTAGKVNRIILTRPVIEAGERLGFLPGDLYEKVSPYLTPLFDAFYVMLGSEQFRRYREDGVVEIVPLAYMRGRTLENAFIILDEAQNTVSEQMKMFLTRFGPNSKVVITGDITQIDLDGKERSSGLVLIRGILSGIKDIKFIWLSEVDVVRHKLVRDIIKAYEKWDNNKK